LGKRPKKEVYKQTGEAGYKEKKGAGKRVFFGSASIKNEINDSCLTLDFINRTLKNNNLSKPYKKKQKGGSVYMLYPKDWLLKLGEILMQIDFIGPRYLEGSSEPLHFLSCKYVRPFKMHLFFRIKSQTSIQVLNVFYTLFLALHLPVPDIVQMDNDSSFRGFIEREACIGRVVRWLCASGIIPLFNAPRSPWNNGSVEGGNNVFDKKFWQGFHFESIKKVDEKLKEFNKAYETYLIPDYTKSKKEDLKHITDPRKAKGKNLNSFPQPYLYLLRVVKERYDRFQVEALNTYFTVPSRYKGQYVIIRIDLVQKTIRIWQEINNKENLLYSGPFYLNS